MLLVLIDAELVLHLQALKGLRHCHTNPRKDLKQHGYRKLTYVMNSFLSQVYYLQRFSWGRWSFFRASWRP